MKNHIDTVFLMKRDSILLNKFDQLIEGIKATVPDSIQYEKIEKLLGNLDKETSGEWFNNWGTPILTLLSLGFLVWNIMIIRWQHENEMKSQKTDSESNFKYQFYVFIMSKIESVKNEMKGDKFPAFKEYFSTNEYADLNGLNYANHYLTLKRLVLTYMHDYVKSNNLKDFGIVVKHYDIVEKFLKSILRYYNSLEVLIETPEFKKLEPWQRKSVYLTIKNDITKPYYEILGSQSLYCGISMDLEQKLGEEYHALKTHHHDLVLYEGSYSGSPLFSSNGFLRFNKVLEAIELPKD
jgi:hypothetical protein